MVTSLASQQGQPRRQGFGTQLRTTTRASPRVLWCGEGPLLELIMVRVFIAAGCKTPHASGTQLTAHRQLRQQRTAPTQWPVVVAPL